MRRIPYPTLCRSQTLNTTRAHRLRTLVRDLDARGRARGFGRLVLCVPARGAPHLRDEELSAEAAGEIQRTGRATPYLRHHAWRAALWHGEIGSPRRQADRHPAFRGRASKCWGSRPKRLRIADRFGRNVQECPAVRMTCKIGGHARSEGPIVVTNNMREFGRMPGIRAENWI